MLDTYRQAHEQTADLYIPDWRKMSKADLINNCVDSRDDPKLFDAYMSAVICKYWYFIDRYDRLTSNSIKHGGEDKEIYYDWLVSGICKAVNDSAWKNPDCPIYGDPDGAQKAVVECLETERRRWYFQMNMRKRSERYKYSHESLDNLAESGDSLLLCTEDTAGKKEEEADLARAIRSLCGDNDYFMAFLLDTITRYDVAQGGNWGTGTPYKFSARRTLKHIRHPEDGYAEDFSKRFGVPCEDVKKALEKYGAYAIQKSYKLLKADMNRLRLGVRVVQTGGEW